MEEHRIRELQIDINSLLESGVFSENDKLHDYFTEVIGFASRLCSVWGRFHKMEEDRQVIPLEELIDINAGLYEQILPENYSSSYVNPEYAVKAFGTDIGRLLCAISAEIRAAIPSVFGKDLSGFVSRLLLILDTARAASEDLSAESLRSVFYKYYHDNLPFEQKKSFIHSWFRDLWISLRNMSLRIFFCLPLTGTTEGLCCMWLFGPVNISRITNLRSWINCAACPAGSW